MIEQYRNDMNQLHASEELIQTTLHRINCEVQQNKVHKKKWTSFMATGVVAAAIALFIFAFWPSKAFYYNVVNEEGTISNRPMLQTDTMSISEYGTYLGIDVEHLLPEDRIKDHIVVQYDEDKKVPKSEQATLYYYINDSNVTVKLSKTQSVSLEELTNGKASKVNGHEVYFAKMKDTKQLIAAGTIDEINFNIVADDMQQKEFESLVKNILKKM